MILKLILVMIFGTIPGAILGAILRLKIVRVELFGNHCTNSSDGKTSKASYVFAQTFQRSRWVPRVKKTFWVVEKIILFKNWHFRTKKTENKWWTIKNNICVNSRGCDDNFLLLLGKLSTWKNWGNKNCVFCWSADHPKTVLDFSITKPCSNQFEAGVFN